MEDVKGSKAWDLQENKNFFPVVRELKVINAIIELYEDRISTIERLMEDNQQQFRKCCSHIESEQDSVKELDELMARLEGIKREFEETKQSGKNFVWMKVQRGYLNEIDDSLKAFTNSVDECVFQALLRIHQNNFAEKFKKELEGQLDRIKADHEFALIKLTEEKKKNQELQTNNFLEKLANNTRLIEKLLEHANNRSPKIQEIDGFKTVQLYRQDLN